MTHLVGPSTGMQVLPSTHAASSQSASTATFTHAVACVQGQPPAARGSLPIFTPEANARQTIGECGSTTFGQPRTDGRLAPGTSKPLFHTTWTNAAPGR